MRTVYIYFNTDGYAEQWSSAPGYDHIEFELEDDHAFFSKPIGSFFNSGGVLVFDQAKYDQIVNPPPPPPARDLGAEVDHLNTIIRTLLGDSPARQIETAQQIRKALDTLLQGFADSSAGDLPDLYPEWSANTAYTMNQIVKVSVSEKAQPKLYRVAQTHVSTREGWPDRSPLYKRIQGPVR